MGAACCVAAKDRTISNGSSGEIVQRNVRNSPSWSFRWDNRRRVAGEETSLTWSSDGVSRNDGLDFKSRTTVGSAYASEEGSPMNISQNLMWQKSPVAEENRGTITLPPSDLPLSRNSTEAKDPRASPAISDLSTTKMSPSMRSVSSVSASPLSSKSHLLPLSSTPSRWPRRSPGHQLLRQVSDSRIRRLKSPSFSISEEGSPFVLPGWNYDSLGMSQGGSSDNWAIPEFTELMPTSHRERWSFDSDSLGMIRHKLSRSSGRSFSSPPTDIKACGLCSKLITQRSSWASQKIMANSELAVHAVLVCGHVYHAECLEKMTPEFSKYDPTCPVCTLGEKAAFKLSEKAMRAEMDLMTRISKKLRNRVVGSDLSSDSVVFDRQRSSGHESRSYKLSTSSSMKSSFGKPFFKRRFSFGSKGTKSPSENHSTRKSGLFWSKSSKK